MQILRRGFAALAATLGAAPAALWILKHERQIRRSGRSLDREETDFARRLGIRNPDTVRVRVVPEVPAPFGGLLAPLENRIGFSLRHAAGVTLGTGIYVARDCESIDLVAHELVHVRQYQDFRSPLVFIWHYFYQCAAFGYCDAPLEREAEELSRDPLPRPNDAGTCGQRFDKIAESAV